MVLHFELPVQAQWLLVLARLLIPVSLPGVDFSLLTAAEPLSLSWEISLLLSVFGVNVAYFGSTSALSIGINVVICAVAAFNFLIDFRFIDQLTSQVVAPKYMEWYAGFSLIVTLVWLYLEILRLLARTRDN